ncbi:MAG: CsiV family protein [Pseudomonadota bacterium]
MTLRSLFHAVLGGVALAVTVTTSGQEPAPAYQVDVIVFRHAEPFPAGEVFDLSRQSAFIPTYSDRLPAPVEDDDDAPVEEAPPTQRRLADYPALPEEALALSETARRLGNATRFTLLTHEGWLQDALPTEEAPHQRISAGGVRGTVLLSRSRFLRLDVELNFSVDGQPVTLAQTRRRVQLDKPHYIDHPYVGAIIQVSRAPSPEP